MAGRYSAEAAQILFIQPDGSISAKPGRVPVMEVLLPASINARPDGQKEIDTRGEDWRRQFALVDTGADCCGMAPGVAVALGLDPIARQGVLGVTGQAQVDVVSHPVFITGARTMIDANFVRLDHLAGRTYSFIIGMDILSQGRLVMDRQAGEFSFHPWLDG